MRDFVPTMEPAAPPTALAPNERAVPDPALASGRHRMLAAWPEAMATLLLLAISAFYIWQVKKNEGGRFVYTLDDSYFHMAVAKNLLRHGIWGTSAPAGFSAGTSSLLWPLLLALCFAVFGIHEFWPLVLNLLAAVGLLFYAGHLIRRTTGSSVLSLIVLCALTVLTPIFVVASTGMEHCLQALLTLIFVDVAARLLSSDEQRLASLAEVALCVVSALVVMTRYEGLFAVAPVGLLLLCQRRWRLAIALGVAAATPITLFGLYAMSKGWYFLPNSLLLKGNLQPVHTFADFLQYISKWYVVLTITPYVFSLVALMAVAFVASVQRRWNLWNYPALFLCITLVTTVEHLQFAALGWFYRYEAYLIVLGFVGVSVTLGYEAPRLGWRYWLSARSLPYAAGVALLALLFGPPLWERAMVASATVTGASYNIYEQQYQMAHFIRRYYRNKGVAANDVGAISFFCDVNLLDVVGLCDIDVLRGRRTGTIDNEMMRRLCKKHHVELMVGYPEWRDAYGGLVPEWVPVGEWTIPHNVIVAVARVTFYAPSLDLAPTVMRRLREFSAELPKDITQSGLYYGSHSPQVTGGYGVEGDDSAASYATKDWVQAAMYPPENAPLESPDTLLQLTLVPVAKDLAVDVFINDQLVETKRFSPENPLRWLPFRVNAKWRAGVNTVRLIGHGTPILVPGDPRPMLFRVLDPRRVMEANTVVPQGIITTATP